MVSGKQLTERLPIRAIKEIILGGEKTKRPYEPDTLDTAAESQAPPSPSGVECARRSMGWGQ